MDWIKDSIQNSLKFTKRHLKKTGGYSYWNAVNTTPKMKTIVWSLQTIITPLVRNFRQLLKRVHLDSHTLSTWLRIHLPYLLWRSKTPLQGMSWYDTKLHLEMKLLPMRSGDCGVPFSLPLLPCALWLRNEVPVRVSSMGQIKLVSWVWH